MLLNKCDSPARSRRVLVRPPHRVHPVVGLAAGRRDARVRALAVAVLRRAHDAGGHADERLRVVLCRPAAWRVRLRLRRSATARQPCVRRKAAVGAVRRLHRLTDARWAARLEQLDARGQPRESGAVHIRARRVRAQLGNLAAHGAQPSLKVEQPAVQPVARVRRVRRAGWRSMAAAVKGVALRRQRLLARGSPARGRGRGPTALDVRFDASRKEPSRLLTLPRVAGREGLRGPRPARVGGMIHGRLVRQLRGGVTAARRERRGWRISRRRRRRERAVRGGRAHRLAERRKRLDRWVARERVDEAPCAHRVVEQARVAVACAQQGRTRWMPGEPKTAALAAARAATPASWHACERLSARARIMAESMCAKPVGIALSLPTHCSILSCSGCAAAAGKQRGTAHERTSDGRVRQEPRASNRDDGVAGAHDAHKFGGALDVCDVLREDEVHGGRVEVNFSESKPALVLNLGRYR